MNTIPQGFTELFTTPQAAVSIIALLFAIITLWHPTRFKLPIVFLTIYLIFGVLSQHIQLIALPFIAALGFTYFIAQHTEFNKILRFIVGVGAIILSIAFFVHSIPGITNIRVIHATGPNSYIPLFAMYLNLDKPLVGFFILFFGSRLIQQTSQWREMLLKTLPIALIGLAIILMVALLLKLITFEPKFNSLFFIWATANLFFTTVADEALYRGFVLHYADAFCTHFKFGQYFSLALVSIGFGALHYTDGWHYILLATLTSLIYGYIYQKTRRVEASILTHFTLNLTYFLLGGQA